MCNSIKYILLDGVVEYMGDVLSMNHGPPCDTYLLHSSASMMRKPLPAMDPDWHRNGKQEAWVWAWGGTPWI